MYRMRGLAPASLKEKKRKNGGDLQGLMPTGGQETTLELALA